ncbi:TerC family protein [Bordetella sp. BOR01]|uniref:TerC family protein n=1 Tax=Bordetella sp. BOR01 TaxID=2854779 RepID=UPI001C4523C2|nr:TerC family protein [Bordetella sp. BOR01]MBV7483885.1 TerC family protein [Bordetella sp. BOR01]
MIFDWMADPTAWLGLATLVVLEIVLGIDNLVFIAILADKLPPHQRNRARVIGLTLAMLMRLGLLASIAWVVTLTHPLFTVLGAQISGRDLILILGGMFLLFKGTMELHERVEGRAHGDSNAKVQHAVFWQVILQIVVLDAVFSLDSVITAVGMVQELSIMMIAVVAAMAVMMLASRPLMAFVGRHPTVVILCLGLLLMIGFSLVAEGLGFHVPKGYLYAAIGFAIVIELCNQLARRNRSRRSHGLSGRQRTAQAVLRLLRGNKSAGGLQNPVEEVAALVDGAGDDPVFAPEESSLIERILAMGTRDVRAIMVPRSEMVWLDVKDSADAIVRKFASGHARLPLCDGDAANVIGVLHFKDLLPRLQMRGAIDLVELARPPHYVSETTPVFKVLEVLRQSREHMLIVVDEHGSGQGLVTPLDVLTAVGGELPEHSGPARQATRMENGAWILDAGIPIDEARVFLASPELAQPTPDATLAGALLRVCGRLPDVGETIQWDGWAFEITQRDGLRIGQVRAERLAQPA